MSIVKPDQTIIDDCVDVICKGFSREYQAMFRIPAFRLKPFVKLSIEQGDSWALVEDGAVKGVLVLTHPKCEGASMGSIFKLLFKTIPFWSAAFAVRYVLAPKVTIKDAVHIDQVAVSEQFRNQGVGQRLLEFAQEQTKELGFSKLYLRVRADNPAFHLYKRFGFETYKEISSVIFSSASGCRTAIYMVKNVCS